MKGDYSRFSFDAKKHYRAVLMQQGRLQLDSDWNEQVQMMEHRYNAFFQSMVGRSGTPKNDGMKLYVDGDELKLSGSVYYIDGLLIENEGFITLDVPPNNGTYLYYLDAWAREVSAAEDGNLIDPAIGLETTMRLKTEWVVRYQDVAASGITETEKKKYKMGNWSELSSGNWWKSLSTGTLKLVSDSGKVDKGDNRVIVDKDDNRLYRIEVHQDNPALPGYIFKWSADNASICAEITTVDKKLFTLKNNTPDLQNAFKDAAWIELYILGEPGKSEGLWQRFELSNESGNSFDSNSGSLTLKDSCEKAGGASKIIMRRWDGVFPEENKKNSLALELGVDFEYVENEFYRHGDYWLVQIRNGKIVNWKAGDIKEPEGVEHHFAALGIMIKLGKNITVSELLRVAFNPLTNPDLSTLGDVIIGGTLTVNGNTTSPEEAVLTVNGNTNITGTLTVPNIAASVTIGTEKNDFINDSLTVHGGVFVYGRFENKLSMDLAENFKSLLKLEPGDVVCLGSDKDHICLSEKQNDELLLGIISTKPGLVLNGCADLDNLYPVALSGRVPCKVTNEGGSICRGDLLTSSSTPGKAMKAQPIKINGQDWYVPGTIIGKALESMDEKEGLIEVFVFLK